MEELAVFGGKPVREKPIFYGRQYIDQEDVEAVTKVLTADVITSGPHTLLSSSDKRSVSHHVSNSLDTSSCLLSLTALISNIIRIHFGISCGNADGIFVGEKCEHSSG